MKSTRSPHGICASSYKIYSETPATSSPNHAHFARHLRTMQRLFLKPLWADGAWFDEDWYGRRVDPRQRGLPPAYGAIIHVSTRLGPYRKCFRSTWEWLVKGSFNRHFTERMNRVQRFNQIFQAMREHWDSPNITEVVHQRCGLAPPPQRHHQGINHQDESDVARSDMT